MGVFDLFAPNRLRICLPTHDQRTPSQSRAETAQYIMFAPMDQTLPHRFIQGDGHRRSRGIAIPLNVGLHPVAWDAEHIRGRQDDADIGLMRDEAIYIVQG